MLAADSSFTLSNRLAPPIDRRQRGFWIALGCALVLHATLLVEANRTAPRRVGSAEGSNDAIAVEIVTEADLKSRETVAVPPPGAPPVPPPQPQTAPEPAPQPEPEAKPAEPAPQPPPEPEPKAAEPAPAPPPETQPKQEAEKPASEFDLPDLADVAPLPEKAKPAEKEVKAEPAEKQSKPETQKNEPPKKKEQPQKQARLDPPASPRDAPQATPDRGSSFSRPPGITQSGENDAFGRGVIRALRATMPPPSGIFGRVTVRLLLNENGDLFQVQVVESSGQPNLDQSIVFATKQSNFPLPPVGSTVADRTFLISYVYR